ncbi:lipopolysaccharide biosynthesis protein [Shewanella marina]|uniref:lipopolysaccharide biosynthesis protein n=1 Tax=Shewanella marina TaxID=487319 RepID=UPI0004720495|nr:hypothetical protein [Shewanella marina]
MRVKKSLNNFVANIFSFFLVLIITFISRKVFIDNLGVEIFGLNALLSNFITLMSLADLGIGAAIVYSFYKPINDGDRNKVSSLLHYYRKIYRFIALFVLLVGLCLSYLFYKIGSPDLSFELFLLIYSLMLINTACSYLVASNRSLIYASQDAHLMVYPDLFFKITLLLLQIAILKSGLTFPDVYILFVAITIVITLLNNIFVHFLAKVKYKQYFIRTTDNVSVQDKKTIKTKMIGVMHHKVGDLIVNYSDLIIVSTVSTLKNVGILSNYNIITTSIILLVAKIFDGAAASLGNLIVNDKKRAHEIFKILNYVMSLLFTNVCFFMLFLLTPFIHLWIGDRFTFSFNTTILITVALLFKIARIPVITMKVAGGVFEQDKYVPIGEAVIYIVLAVLLSHQFGINGVFIASILTSLFFSNWIKPLFLYKYVFNLPLIKYVDSIAVLFKITLPTLLLVSAAAYYADFHVTSWLDYIIFFCVSIFSLNIAFVLFSLNTTYFKYFKNLVFKNS